MTPTLRSAALSILLCTAPFAARADWTGKLKIHVEPETPEGDQDGTIAGHGAKMRIDMERTGAGKVGLIFDMKEHRATMIMDGRKAFMTMDADQMRGPSQLGQLHCDSTDAAVCLKQAGFTKTGAESVNGKKSDRWEADRDVHGSKTHETLWVPQGVKGFAMIKQITKSPERTTTLDVLDFTETSVPADRFEPPAGYTDMGSHGGPMGPPGGRGPMQGPQSMPPGK